ncbi:hypothetical protein [Massilia genomosp. 1]|nr:hypothetical protein [Massilia genomosp. 1]
MALLEAMSAISDTVSAADGRKWFFQSRKRGLVDQGDGCLTRNEYLTSFPLYAVRGESSIVSCASYGLAGARRALRWRALAGPRVAQRPQQRVHALRMWRPGGARQARVSSSILLRFRPLCMRSRHVECVEKLSDWQDCNYN